MKKEIKAFIKAVLPPQVLRILRKLRRHRDPGQKRNDLDLIEYPIQENVRLQVYWKDERGLRGPAASLYVYDDEVLRFDCFDGNQAHCHVNLKQTHEHRWYYPEGTVQEHIERSTFDLRVNHPFILLTNQDRRIQTVKIDSEKLEQVINQMKAKMLEFAHQLGL